MKRLSFVLAFMLIFTALFANPFLANAEENQAVTITVLDTTDIHGNIYDWAYESQAEDDDVGLSKVYTVVKQVREENPNTILISLSPLEKE